MIKVTSKQVINAVRRPNYKEKLIVVGYFLDFTQSLFSINSGGEPHSLLTKNT